MRNILVINVNWLGDVVFSSPVFPALKKQYPRAKIVCLAVPRVCPAIECMEGVDEVIAYDEKGKHRSVLGKLTLIIRLRKYHFQAAFILHKSLTRALIARLAGIPIRVGYDTKKRAKHLTHIVEHSPAEEHRSSYYLRVIQSFGVEIQEPTCRLQVSEVHKNSIRGKLASLDISDQDFVLVVHVCGNWDLKRWPQGSFRNCIEKLSQSAKYKIVIPGTEKDRRWIHGILQGLQPAPVLMIGNTDLKEFIALMQRADLVLSADSGPLHVANAVGTYTVALYGPTRPEITGPRGAGKFQILQHDVGCNRQPCYHLTCPDNICMQSITVEQVINAVNSHFNQ
ncbi:MAG: lipopolysaccharide heptosyltransferase II [Candidatus Omnitrophica bacterium]|nr:lipopolysaccharide heptosyltransferase II [Candidatus Omnitrophota bacterium]